MEAITLERVEDVDLDRNRGWQVDKVLAKLDGAEVGYLNISYIPMARFESYYSVGILSYCSLMGGHCLFDGATGREDHYVVGFDDEKLRTFVRRAAWIFLHRDFSSTDDLARMERPELLALVDEISARATLTQGAKFRSFKRFHVNKPVIDFIRVSEDLRRQGIATALYIEGAKWMASKRMRLHSSGLQQPEAAAAWQKMEERGWVLKDRARRYLDVARIVSRPMLNQRDPARTA